MKAVIVITSIISIIALGFKGRVASHTPPDLKRNQVQQIYTAELGVKEKTGNNDGGRVEQYLRHVGLKKGDPWCAAFVCWVLDRAAVDNPRTGWSPSLFAKGKVVWNRNRKVVITTNGVAGAVKSLPKKGDVFGIWFPDKGRIAHVGFVDSWSAKWLITVEGNTNEAGSREGDGVWRKRRLIVSIYQVSQFID